jgi:peroxiredoxin
VSRAGIVVIALLAVSCGGGTDVRTAVDDLATEPAAETSEQPATDAPTAAPTSGPTSGVEPAPEALAALDFQARTVGGGTIDGTTLAGTRTVLWIWAPWCPQCNREAPNVKAAIERFGDDLTIVGVAGKDTDAEHEQFVDRHDLDAIPHAIDEDGSLWAKYGVGYQPAWVFIAEDGTTRVAAGGLYDDLEPTLEDFLNS